MLSDVAGASICHVCCSESDKSTGRRGDFSWTSTGVQRGLRWTPAGLRLDLEWTLEQVRRVFEPAYGTLRLDCDASSTRVKADSTGG